MGATAIRQRLQDYIRFADDRKVKAIYTMVEAEINTEYDRWGDPQYLEMLSSQSADLKSGKVKGKTWEEIKERFDAKRR